MKMRDLERRTGVNRETIRVYLRHGLMPEPNRPARNSADYGEEHVRAITAIRKLQKEQRLPLHEIRRAMQGDSTALSSDVGAFQHLDELIAARAGVDESLVSLASLRKNNVHADSDAEILESVGAITRIRKGRSFYLNRIDAQLLGIWAELRAAGYTEELGFYPDVCRLHVEAAQKLAHEELQIFLDRLEGRSLEEPAADMAQAALKHLLGFFGLIRVKTVLADLRNRQP